MDFLGDLANDADGSLQIDMTIEAFLLLIGMITYAVIQVVKYLQKRKNGNGGRSAHALVEEKLLRENGKLLAQIEGHLSTQGGTMQNLVNEQRGTTDAVRDMEKELSNVNTRIETFLQVRP